MHKRTNHTNPWTMIQPIHRKSKKTHNLAHPIPFPPMQEINTCLHLLSIHTNTALNNIWTTKHNKAVWQIDNFIVYHSSTRDTFLMNVGTHLGSPPKNTIPPWLHLCICTTRRCPCLTRLNPNIFIITDTSLEKTIHYTTQDSSRQFIEFKFYQDCNPKVTTQRKNTNIPTLVEALEDPHWYVTLTTLTTSIWGSIHTNTITNPLRTMLHTFNAYTHMHATNPHESSQISHPIHAQQTKTGKPSTPNNSCLKKNNNKIPRMNPTTYCRNPLT